MRVRKASLVISSVLCTIACSAVQAQSSPDTQPPDTQITIGAKVWHASWLSYLPATYNGVTPTGNPTFGDSINAVEAKEKTDVMPHLHLRHKKFFVSASYGDFSTDFRVLTDPDTMVSPGQNVITWRNDRFKRREGDFNVGYAVTPNIGLALGYKHATETRDVSRGTAPEPARFVKTTAKGFLVGAVGGFPVTEKLSLYFQAGYGPARLKLKFTDPRLGTAKTDGRYTIGEIGLSYPLYKTARGSGTTASIGYRTQTIKTDGYESVFQESRDLRDVRDGVVLTLNVTL